MAWTFIFCSFENKKSICVETLKYHIINIEYLFKAFQVSKRTTKIDVDSHWYALDI